MKFLVSILLLFTSFYCKADISFWSYFLKGKIIGNNGRPIINSQCSLKLGHSSRVFITDGEGNYFVEVIYAMPCMSRLYNQPYEVELNAAKEINGDTIIVWNDQGTAYLNAGWEKYYSRKEKHNCFERYKGLNLIEQVDITLNKPPVLIQTEFNFHRNELLETLSRLNKIPIDSFKQAAKIEIDRENHLYLLPNGVTHRIYDDSDQGFRETILWECYISHINTAPYLYRTFANKEMRNRHIASLSKDEFLGNYPNLFELNKKNDNEYILAINRFKPESSYFTFYTDNSGYITDIIYTDPRN